MSIAIDPLRDSIIQYCVQIGEDPLLVQGAGGNVSWKDGKTLWVKASGTWLVDAAKKEIFVPVDLMHLQTALNADDFEITPRLLGESNLKPSIETLLHALMPQRIVVHLHAVEVLAYLVRQDCEIEINNIVKDRLIYSIVDYYKPGAQLAKNIKSALLKTPETEVIFLKNHGVVIAGNDLSDIFRINKILKEIFYSPQTPEYLIADEQPKSLIKEGIEYLKIDVQKIQQLVFNPDLFKRLKNDWALYPDHIVFLGAAPRLYESAEQFIQEKSFSFNNINELIFIKNFGIFHQKNLDKAVIAQLNCYYEIIARQSIDQRLTQLSKDRISEILDWDAEKYRISLQISNLKI